MIFLLDTHILLWAAAGSDRLPPVARRLIEDPANVLVFSAASLREIAIKGGVVPTSKSIRSSCIEVS